VTGERWLTLAVVSAATAMLLLDVTVVNVALPAIRSDLDARFAELQWVIDAYALTLAATLLGAGVLADRHGRRCVFAVGLAVFTICSAFCAAAPTAVVLDPAPRNTADPTAGIVAGLDAVLAVAAAIALAAAVICCPLLGRQRSQPSSPAR